MTTSAPGLAAFEAMEQELRTSGSWEEAMEDALGMGPLRSLPHAVGPSQLRTGLGSEGACLGRLPQPAASADDDPWAGPRSEWSASDDDVATRPRGCRRARSEWSESPERRVRPAAPQRRGTPGAMAACGDFDDGWGDSVDSPGLIRMDPRPNGPQLRAFRVNRSQPADERWDEAPRSEWTAAELGEDESDDRDLSPPPGASDRELLASSCVLVHERGVTCADELACAICLDAVKTGERVRLLPCFHRFHVSCIDRWLLQTRACPVCKRDITDHSNPFE